MEDQFEAPQITDEINPKKEGYRSRSPWITVLFLLAIILVWFVVLGPLIGFLIAIPFIEGSILDFAQHVSNPTDHPEIKTPLFIIQGCATFFGLAFGPALYWWSSEKRNPFDFFKKKHIPPVMIFVTIVIVVGFMATNSVFIDWNANVKFPDFLRGFEQWAKQTEAHAAELTAFLTTFNSPGEFVFTFFIIAILAGFSEELVFRGMIQPELKKATHNIHAAIWISAFLFSALHMQFFGFVPRVLLGALFGYLYYWSGNLLISMFAHMVNNGFSVLIIYLHQLGKIEMDVETTEAAPWPAVIFSAVLTGGLLYYFYTYYHTRKTSIA